MRTSIVGVYIVASFFISAVLAALLSISTPYFVPFSLITLLCLIACLLAVEVFLK